MSLLLSNALDATGGAEVPQATPVAFRRVGFHPLPTYRFVARMRYDVDQYFDADAMSFVRASSSQVPDPHGLAGRSFKCAGRAGTDLGGYPDILFDMTG